MEPFPQVRTLQVGAHLLSWCTHEEGRALGWWPRALQQHFIAISWEKKIPNTTITVFWLTQYVSRSQSNYLLLEYNDNVLIMETAVAESFMNGRNYIVFLAVFGCKPYIMYSYILHGFNHIGLKRFSIYFCSDTWRPTALYAATIVKIQLGLHYYAAPPNMTDFLLSENGVATSSIKNILNISNQDWSWIVLAHENSLDLYATPTRAWCLRFNGEVFYVRSLHTAVPECFHPHVHEADYVILAEYC